MGYIPTQKLGFAVKGIVIGCLEGVNRKVEIYTFTCSNVQLVKPWLAQLQSLHLKQGWLKRIVTDTERAVPMV